MRILIDTPVWSFGLRRDRGNLSRSEFRLVLEWEALIRQRRVVLIGPVRQELLSGVRQPQAFERLREQLRAFEDAPLCTEDYERAAWNNNRCRAAGVTGSAVDLLLCAVAERFDVAIFTPDTDFKRYAKHLPIRLHRATEARHPE